MTHGPLEQGILNARANELARQELDGTRRSADRLFAGLMLLQFLAAMVLVLVISPHTWIGAERSIHPHVWATAIIGLLIASAPLVLVRIRPGTTLTRCVIAASQMLFSALLIHVTGGRIETHFHVFGSLAFLAVYRDYRVMMIAAGITAVDHYVRGLYWPQSVFGVVGAGAYRWIEHTGWVVFELVFLCMSIRQSLRQTRLTAHRSAELEDSKSQIERLVRSQARELTSYSAAIDTAGIVFVTDVDGRIIEVNDNLCAVSGSAREELIGMTLADLASEMHDDAYFGAMRKAIANGEVFRDQFSGQAADASHYWLDLTVVPMLDEQGDPERLVGLAVDQSALKASEHDLRLHQQWLHIALESASAGFWDFDIENERFTASDRFFQMLAIESTDAPQPLSMLRDHLHPDDRARFDETLKNVSANPGTRFDMQYRLRTGDGSYRWLRATGTVIETTPDGRAVRLIGTQIDVTELLDSRDRAEAASRAKSDFLANMSHEIRTPMTAILGYIDLLEAGDDGGLEAPADAIRTIRSNANHLLTIINDILDVSKIEAGKMAIESIPMNPLETLEQVSSLLRPRAAEKGLQFNVAFDTPIPESIMSDPTRLRQVLMNIVGNAIKFTDSGIVEIRLSCRPSDQVLELHVVDSGIGMTPEQAEAIRCFDPFQQADNTMTRRFGGTGLGLRISDALTRALGGELSLTSEPGSGSRFTATISTGPLADVPMLPPEQITLGLRPSRRPESDPKRQAEQPLKGLRVLFAEDGPDNQRLISFHLRRAGADVTIADNGRIAIEAFESAPTGEPFDVVLMDMQMPEVDGYEATRRLRSLGCRVPIIALTAHAMSGDRAACLKTGCDEYLTKPIDRTKLIEACAQWGRDGSSRAAA